MRHLHVGIHVTELLKAHKVVRQTFAVHMDGDGWEAWGEAPGTDVNDAETFHFIVEVKGKGQAERALQALRRTVTLVPMRVPNQANIVAILTDREDWGDVRKVWSE